MLPTLPKLYPITDVYLSGLSHAAQVERLARGGATLIQLRHKSASPREFYAEALKAVAAGRELGVRVIINDRVDVALAVKADGVHLGQDDLPPADARKLLGPDRIIGFSTHTLEQALEAASMPVDYIALGPIFGTSTKQNPDEVVGLDIIGEIKSRISKPLVAIGGITLATVKSVLDAGADSAAVISDLVAHGDPGARVKEFLARISAEV